ncbi:MAG: hypothetical protein U0992_14505 [Planctomycetaceae bacterium]
MLRAVGFLATMLCVGAGLSATRADDAADAKAIAARLLDDSLSQAERKKVVEDHPAISLDLIRVMTDGLESGKEEYRRIPWIWRVAISAARRNQGTQIRDILVFSLPAKEQPLRDWQAVVIGGGIINGLSQQQVWPRTHIAELLKNDATLQARWDRLLVQAADMADDESVFTGTRYDALRILGCGEWEPHGVHLLQYLEEGTNDELQMGAVSALIDIDSPYSTKALSDAFLFLKATNRRLAIAGLLRDSGRCDALLFSIESGRLGSVELNDDQTKSLREHPEAKVRDRAAKVLSSK